jgi:hypothetical protein
MVELTISFCLGEWLVAPMHMTANRMINPTIACSTFDEAMGIHEQLNGKKLQEIEAFIKLRNQLAL